MAHLTLKDNHSLVDHRYEKYREFSNQKMEKSAQSTSGKDHLCLRELEPLVDISGQVFFEYSTSSTGFVFIFLSVFFANHAILNSV